MTSGHIGNVPGFGDTLIAYNGALRRDADNNGLRHPVHIAPIDALIKAHNTTSHTNMMVRSRTGRHACARPLRTRAALPCPSRAPAPLP